MLLKAIRVEAMKLRRSPVWIAFFTLPALCAVMGTFNYLQNTGILKQAWYSLWTQHTLFSAFFFTPSLIGLMCACQWRVEHQGNNFNQLLTLPVPYWMLCVSKLIIAILQLLAAQLWTGVLFYISGRLAGLTEPFPAETLSWLALSFCGGCAVCAVQLALSMRIRSFAIPVGVALAGGILGLAMANMGYGLACPYALMSMGMNANGAGAVESLPLFFVMCALWLTAPMAYAVNHLASPSPRLFQHRRRK